MQLRDSTDSLILEKREKITISAVTAWQKLTADFVAKEEGEVTVFIDNQDTEPVYFDELELRVERQPTLVITQEHHYYPFGMNMSGIERKGDLMYQFNGMIEREEAFSLELYETPFRSYDAQLGRFWQVEPLADIYVGISVFQFAYNNPVSFNDPTGLSSDTGTGDGKEKKEELVCPLCDRPINIEVSPMQPLGGGTKIGGGGYTWELGNTRGFASYGSSSPMSNPYGRSTISIFNLNNDPDVTAGIEKAKKFLSEQGININLMEKSEVDLSILNPNRGNPIDLARGQNAAYLFGEGEKLLEYTRMIDPDFSESNGTQYTAQGGCTTCIENANSGNLSINETNMAVIGTHRLKNFMGLNFSRTDAVALTILHVLGHNAGILEHNHATDRKTNRTARVGIMSEGRELSNFISAGVTFEYITNMNTSITDHLGNTVKVNEVWKQQIKSYFEYKTNQYNFLNLLQK